MPQVPQDPELVAGITAFLARGPRRVVFSEQNLTALERLIVVHAADGEDLDDITGRRSSVRRRRSWACRASSRPPSSSCAARRQDLAYLKGCGTRTRT